jgi:diguanylate cyclase (GGDEF)-like protein
MSIRILVVDDNEVNLELLVAMLESEHYVVSTGTDGFEALAKIAAEKLDIVLLDVLMPGLGGFEVCRRIKADPTRADIPVIMVTALSHVDDLVRGFEAGADDFVTKPFDFLALMARVHLQLRRKRDYEHVREQALVDPITRAFNRWYYDAHAPRLAARCRAGRESLTLLMIDVDNLRQVNDAHGHPAGDRVLKQVVGRVTSALRPSDLVARLGGDEFTVVMPETGLDAALQIAERLRRRVGDTPIEGVAATVSIGVATSRPDAEEELDATLQRADAALYKAKGDGGNCVIADGSVNPPYGPPRGRFIDGNSGLHEYPHWATSPAPHVYDLYQSECGHRGGRQDRLGGECAVAILRFGRHRRSNADTGRLAMVDERGRCNRLRKVLRRVQRRLWGAEGP